MQKALDDIERVPEETLLVLSTEEAPAEVYNSYLFRESSFRVNCTIYLGPYRLLRVNYTIYLGPYRTLQLHRVIWGRVAVRTYH